MNLGAVILAGGLSRRMGQDKALLRWQGRTLLARQIGTVERLQPAEIFVSGRPGVDYACAPIPVLHDSYPEHGPLGGIERALQATRAPLLLVLAVDMPAMTAACLQELVSLCAEHRGAVLESEGRLQPLAAVYPKRAHALALDLLQANGNSVGGFARRCADRGWVSVHPTAPVHTSCFLNWNSPAEVGRQT